ncbi:retrotransposon protein [Cucumis melo var. makuwa]|uniref:Retrotransposon protein n=1 Tax=Cucumis melo var. makuwa TaxID=1194695 RepID=A0A5D3DHT2_CUCMM|nr:retrotransposon protein [Cucumis melo var. makuwa]
MMSVDILEKKIRMTQNMQLLAVTTSTTLRPQMNGPQGRDTLAESMFNECLLVCNEDVLNMEFPAMYSPRMNMSSGDMMVERSGRSSDYKSSSSGQKKKHDMQAFEPYDLICDAGLCERLG